MIERGNEHGPQEPSPRTILVIEDDPDTQEVYVDMIDTAGFTTVVAAGGHAAMRMLEQGLRPVAILLDIMMPFGDGFLFRSRQRACPELSQIPVIVASAISLTDSDLEQLAPVRHLVKPFTIRELVRTLRLVVYGGAASP